MYKNISILNFSSRVDGNCSSISQYISGKYSNSNVCIHNVSEYVLPCSNCDYECLKPAEKCPGRESMNKMMDRVMESDLIYYVVPNFCGFPCATYFSFNERKVGYLGLDREMMKRYTNIKKKFIIVSNSENEMFYNAMAQQSPNPQILYLKTSKYGKRSIDGDILDSELAKEHLNEFLGKIVSVP